MREGNTSQISGQLLSLQGTLQHRGHVAASRAAVSAWWRRRALSLDCKLPYQENELFIKGRVMGIPMRDKEILMVSSWLASSDLNMA